MHNRLFCVGGVSKGRCMTDASRGLPEKITQGSIAKRRLCRSSSNKACRLTTHRLTPFVGLSISLQLSLIAFFEICGYVIYPFVWDTRVNKVEDQRSLHASSNLSFLHCLILQSLSQSSNAHFIPAFQAFPGLFDR